MVSICILKYCAHYIFRQFNFPLTTISFVLFRFLNGKQVRYGYRCIPRLSSNLIHLVVTHITHKINLDILLLSLTGF